MNNLLKKIIELCEEENLNLEYFEEEKFLECNSFKIEIVKDNRATCGIPKSVD